MPRRRHPNYGRGADSPEVHAIKEHLREARQVVEDTSRDDGPGLVKLWETRLAAQLKKEDAENG